MDGTVDFIRKSGDGYQIAVETWGEPGPTLIIVGSYNANDELLEKSVQTISEFPGLYAKTLSFKGPISSVSSWEAWALPITKGGKKDKDGLVNHKTFPKGYPKKRSEYADPEGINYPIDRGHIHAAIDLFGKWSKRYSPEKRRKMAHRILRAARKFGIEVGKDSEVRRALKGGEKDG